MALLLNCCAITPPEMLIIWSFISLNLYVAGNSPATSTTVTAANVMRKDAENTTNYAVKIKNNLCLIM